MSRCCWLFPGVLLVNILLVSGAVAQVARAAHVSPQDVVVQKTELSCLMQASATVEVGTLAFGALDSVLVQPGDVVRKGQVLAVLDARVERAALLKAQNKVGPHVVNHAGTRVKAPTKVKPVSNFERKTSATTELDLARRKLAQRTITSPLAGVITGQHASVEERVAIITIARIDPLRVDVVMPAALFSSIKPGMVVRVEPEVEGMGSQTATVAHVGAIDAANNTFRAQLTLPNRDLGLPPGMRCKVDLSS